MQKNLAYIRSQVEVGKLVLVGPLTEENRIRGIAVIQAASLEKTQRIASGDPAVQSGHLGVEVHPSCWRTWRECDSTIRRTTSLI